MRLTNQALGSRALSEIRRDIALRHSIQLPGSDPTLVLDLQFARDQAYVSRRGPLPTFTRASVGYCVNSAGLLVPAAINTPRLDYDPTTLVSRGLLIEEQRTNLALRSEDIANATWVKNATTATADQTISPDGTLDADLVAETTASSIHFIYNSAGAAVTTGTTYTQSIFLKKGTGATAPNWILVGFLAGSFGSVTTAFNVSTGQFGASVGSGTYTARQFAGGWWRVTCTAVATATISSAVLYVAFTNNTNIGTTPSYVGQTTSNVFVWGAQFEAGSFATSYIPTPASSAVVRSGDVCSITGGAFTGFYNQTEGTLVFRGVKQALQPTVTPSYLGVDDGTAGNRIIIFGGSSESAFVTTGGVLEAPLGGAAPVAALTSFAIAVRYKANDFAFCLNGGTLSTDVSGTVPTVTQMLLGNRHGANFMGGWIQSVQYYNRIKTNAQLKALSTP